MPFHTTRKAYSSNAQALVATVIVVSLAAVVTLVVLP
jgi:hypothetical protein